MIFLVFPTGVARSVPTLFLPQKYSVKDTYCVVEVETLHSLASVHLTLLTQSYTEMLGVAEFI